MVQSTRSKITRSFSPKSKCLSEKSAWSKLRSCWSYLNFVEFIMKRHWHGIILYFAAFSGIRVIYLFTVHGGLTRNSLCPAVIIVISILMVLNYSHFKVAIFWLLSMCSHLSFSLWQFIIYFIFIALIIDNDQNEIFLNFPWLALTQISLDWWLVIYES